MENLTKATNDSNSYNQKSLPEGDGFRVGLNITHSPINIISLISASHHPEAGAMVLFSGEVRNHNMGKEVEYLEYEAFVPMAAQMIDAIVKEATARWNLNYAVCQHRIGKVGICESAVCTITASAHRKEAYEANQYIIHRVKHEVPIWKKEYFKDGSVSWGNNCNCPDVNNHIEFDAKEILTNKS